MNILEIVHDYFECKSLFGCKAGESTIENNNFEGVIEEKMPKVKKVEKVEDIVES